MEGIRIWKFKVRQCIILHASNQLIGFGTYIYAWRHSYISYATQRSLMKHAAAQTRVLREHGHRRSWGGHKRHLGPKISSMSMQGLLWTLASCCIMQQIPLIVATTASVSTRQKSVLVSSLMSNCQNFVSFPFPPFPTSIENNGLRQNLIVLARSHFFCLIHHSGFSCCFKNVQRRWYEGGSPEKSSCSFGFCSSTPNPPPPPNLDNLYHFFLTPMCPKIWAGVSPFPN